MAIVKPFQPYRYSAQAGPLERLVTQPYDKISPVMQARYLALSPYNLVRIILGERLAPDDEQTNVYIRAAEHLNGWIRDGILVRDTEPALYAYFESFILPGSPEQFQRKGFIGLGPVEEYSAGVVYPHERTLAGPKRDRLELLNHTHAHFGQLFMLYPDREMIVDQILDEAAIVEPTAAIADEYGATHRLWRISDPVQLARIKQAMAEKKLLIADGHHRYETALAFRNANPQIEGAGQVMMTFVNMYSPGLCILPTHRVLRGLSEQTIDKFFSSLQTRRLGSLEELKQVFARTAPDRIRMGIARSGEAGIHLLDRERAAGELDIAMLHEELIGRGLGVSEQAVRDEEHLRYVRGIEAAYAMAQSGDAQIAFLVEPATIKQVAEVAFGGGVMPQKSTDFFPKLLSGLTIYKLL